MRPVVVLPDLHGRADLLEAVTERYPEARYLSLGDAIDRGPQSMATVERLLDLHAAGRATLLMGNHERMAQEGPRWYREHLLSRDLADYRRAMEGYQWWMRAGGETVRRELGRLTLEQFPPLLERYLEIVALRRVVYVTADGTVHDALPGEPSVLVSHAAPPVVHPSYPNPLSAALWLRPFEGPFPLPPGVTYSLHGHTPVRQPARLGQHLYVDLGAYETGRLAVVELGAPGADPRVTILQGRGIPEASRRYPMFGEPLPFDPVALAAPERSFPRGG